MAVHLCSIRQIGVIRDEDRLKVKSDNCFALLCGVQMISMPIFLERKPIRHPDIKDQSLTGNNNAIQAFKGVQLLDRPGCRFLRSLRICCFNCSGGRDAGILTATKSLSELKAEVSVRLELYGRFEVKFLQQHLWNSRQDGRYIHRMNLGSGLYESVLCSPSSLVQMISKILKMILNY